jgi:hypothetical protein
MNVKNFFTLFLVFLPSSLLATENLSTPHPPKKDFLNIYSWNIFFGNYWINFAFFGETKARSTLLFCPLSPFPSSSCAPSSSSSSCSPALVACCASISHHRRRRRLSSPTEIQIERERERERRSASSLGRVSGGGGGERTMLWLLPLPERGLSAHVTASHRDFVFVVVVVGGGGECWDFSKKVERSVSS